MSDKGILNFFDLPEICDTHDLPVTSVDTLRFRIIRDLRKLAHYTTLYSTIESKTLDKIAYLASIFFRSRSDSSVPFSPEAVLFCLQRNVYPTGCFNFWHGNEVA